MSELKKCPNCHSAPDLWVYKMNDQELFFVMCPECRMSTVKREKIGIATDDWNDRYNLGLRVEREMHATKVSDNRERSVGDIQYKRDPFDAEGSGFLYL